MQEAHMKDITEIRRQEFKDSGYPETNRIGKTEERMLPAGGGFRLRTLLYIPDGEGPFPTLLYRTPYPGMQAEAKAVAEEFCKRGFAYVIQMCRGTNGSEGDWEPNVYEKEDGAAVLNWLDEQDWCESIGLFGCSYMAYTCWAASQSVNDKVKAMYVTHYGSDRYASLYRSGLFKMDLMTGWAKDNAGFPIEAGLLESCRYIPQVEVDEALWGKRLDWYRNWITHTEKSDPYWHEGFWEELYQAPGKMKIPVYVGAGWFDHHYGGTLTSFLDLGAEAARHSHLRIGAWNHGFNPCLEGYQGKDLRNSDVKSSLDWFTGILKDKKLPERQVSLYIIGADLWKDFDEFPVPADEVKYFYLNADRTLSPEAERDIHPDNKQNEQCDMKPDTDIDSEAFCAAAAADQVQKDRSGTGTKVSYVYDPEDPVMSHGAESMFTTKSEIGSLLQPGPDYRADVISFVSEPFSEEMTVCGAMKLYLYVSSDAEDTAFTAKIMEVQPDGKAYNIRTSIKTLAFREGEEKRGSYTPGEIVEVVLDNWEVAWKFQKGSRLRIDVSSSDFPQYAIHTNYPGVWSLQDKTRKAVQTLYMDSEHPCRIELPCIRL